MRSYTYKLPSPDDCTGRITENHTNISTQAMHIIQTLRCNHLYVCGVPQHFRH